MAEIRIDLTGLGVEGVRKLFSSHDNLIATCRRGEIEDSDRFEILKQAVEYGAAWVDMDARTDATFIDRMIRVVNSNNCKLILSRHFYTHTPSGSELRDIINILFDMKADVVKVAAMVNHSSDAATILGLYSDYKSNLVAIGMGSQGIITRLAAPLLGAPFTFASYGGNPLTAAGQIDYGELKQIIEKILSYG